LRITDIRVSQSIHLHIDKLLLILVGNQNSTCGDNVNIVREIFRNHMLCHNIFQKSIPGFMMYQHHSQRQFLMRGLLSMIFGICLILG